MTGDIAAERQTQAAVAGAQLADPVLPVQLSPATVINYIEAPPPARVIVRADNTSVETPARSLLPHPLYPGIRVMVAWGPAGESFVMGAIDQPSYPGIILKRANSNQSIPDAADTTVQFDTVVWSAGGVFQEIGGNVRLPFSGIYSASGTVFWDQLGLAGALRDAWARLERLDAAGTFVEQLGWTMDFHVEATYWFIAQNPSCAGWRFNAGDQIRLRVRNDFGGGTARPILATAGDGIQLTVHWRGPGGG